MASKSQPRGSSNHKAGTNSNQHRAQASAKNKKEIELLPSDRNEKTDINPKIAFLAYN